MKKIYIGLAFCFINIFQISAQIDVIPPSPSASGLGEYGKTPVSFYTGKPNISVPLYALKSGDVNMPISLSYNAGGIKVEELASWAGLGWNLNAGGVITRSVNVLADESFPNGYLHKIDQLEEILSKTPSSWTNDEIDNTLVPMGDGTIDGSPDIFYFNFNEHAGSFFFDHDGNAHIVPFQKLKIDVNRQVDDIISFTITDDKGIQYHFGSHDDRSAYDESQTETICNGTSTFNEPARTSWYLINIEDTNHREINFYYESFYLEYANPNASETKTYKLEFVPTLSSTTSCVSVHVINGNHISQITSDQITVTFDGVADRTDFISQVQTEKRLNNISISQNDGTLIKTFEFEHDYFNSGSSEPERKRLKLESITETGSISSKPPYEFTYNSLTLPSRHSMSQDHWGFYNGQNNSTLIPAYLTGTGADREPDENFMKAGILEKITYPTGGQTLYDYQAHQAEKPVNEYTISDCIADPNCNQVVHSVQTNCSPSSHSFCQDNSITFTIDEAWSPKFTVNFNLSSMPENTPYYECDAFITLRKSDGTYVYIQPSNSPGAQFIAAGISCADFSDNGGSASYVPQLPAGTYTLTATKGLEGVTSSATISYFEIEESNPTLSGTTFGFVGGLRIARISDYDPVSDNTIVRKFEYPNPGKTLRKPLYKSHYMSLNEYFESYSSRSQVSLASTKGSIVGYTSVIEQIGENAENGSVEHSFSFVSDGSPSAGLQLPFPPVTSYEWQRGVELSKIEKDFEGNELRSHTYNYDFNETDNQVIIKGYVVDYDKSYVLDRITGNIIGSVVLYSNIATAEVEYISQWQKLDSDIITSNYSTGVIEQQTEYFYENSAHAQLTRKLSTSSNGESMEQKIRYPQDYGYSSNSALDKMVEANMISLPIETIQLVDGSEVSASATKYIYDSTDDQLQADEFYSYESNVPGSGFVSSTDGISFDTYEKKLEVLERDAKGNVLSFKKNQDIITTYVWGYDNTYPVAEIINATYDQVKLALGGDTAITALQSLDGATLRSSLDALRTDPALSIALITTYTYSIDFGMTSITDPNGITTYYEYDDLGRLKLVKDHEGNVLTKNEYNYKGQNASNQ